MKCFFELTIKYAWWVLLLLALMTTGFITQMPKLHLETNIEEMLPKNMDAYLNKQRLEKDFNAADMVVIGVLKKDTEGIYNAHSLALVDELTQWLRTRKEFRTLALADLMSLSTIKNIRGTADGMEVEEFMTVPALSSDDIEQLRHQLEVNGLYIGSIVSADGTGTLIVVRPAAEYLGKYHEVYQVLSDKIEEIKQRGGPEELLITGRPVIEGVFGVYMPRDMQKMQPMILLLLVILLAVSFRSVRGVLIPLTVVILSEIWMLGTMAAMGVPVYTVTTMLPILILAIGIADSVHVLTHIRVEAGRDASLSRGESIVLAMQAMWAPILMTTLTTAAGFLAMLSSELIPMQYFGVFAAVGIVYAFILTVLFIPAIEAVLPKREKALDKLAFTAYLSWITHAVVHRSRQILAAFAVLILISAYGLTQLNVDSSLIHQFNPSDPLRQADVVLNDHFAGTNTLDITIDTDQDDGVLEPSFLKALLKLQGIAESNPLVGDSSSIAESLAEMNKVMHDGDEAWHVAPASSELAAQYLLLYSFSGAPDDFDTFVTSDYRQAHIRIQLKSDASADADFLVQSLKGKAELLFPQMRLEYAGTAYTALRFSDLVIHGQIMSLLLAMSLIFALCCWMFRSLKDAALAMLPVSMAVVVDYGMMGLLDIPLEIGTAITGAMALGIGVDFAIHYLYRYRCHEKLGMAYQDVVARSNEETGRAILFNALVVIGGFMVLLTANLYPQVKLGALVSGSMLVCYLASCYLFPILLRGRVSSS
ncbi:MAG: MMPL family transporter [Mariprofundaceae bacterium]|nr:MMPL family transporter [Mariprofundaceae bacterium]